MKSYLIEITQQQNIIVGVKAESEDDAISLVHNQRGEVLTLLPPALLVEKSRVLRSQDEVH